MSLSPLATLPPSVTTDPPLTPPSPVEPPAPSVASAAPAMAGRMSPVSAPVGWTEREAMRATGVLDDVTHTTAPAAASPETEAEEDDPLFDPYARQAPMGAATSPATGDRLMDPLGLSAAGGVIPIPGVPNGGLAPSEYISLMHLYALTQDADRLLERHHEVLRHPTAQSTVGDTTNDRRLWHGSLTPLDGSRQHANLWYKREDLTASRAYKLRGAFVGMRRVLESNPEAGILAVSTGNHALGVLYAAKLLRPSRVRIVVPNNTIEKKLATIRERVAELAATGVQAEVLLQGNTFDEAKQWALELSESASDYYLDPYANPWVVSGQGTIGLELFRQVKTLLLEQPDVEEVCVVCPIGGGGLLAGIATAFRLATAWDVRLQQVLVRFVGIRLQDLDATYGDAIKVKHVAAGNQRLFERFGIPSLEVTNAHLLAGMLGVYLDLGDRVEGSSGVTHQVVMSHADLLPSDKRLVVCILSGGNAPALPV